MDLKDFNLGMVAVGIALGIALSLTMDNWGFLPVGLIFGFAIGYAGKQFQRDEKPAADDGEPDPPAADDPTRP